MTLQKAITLTVITAAALAFTGLAVQLAIAGASSRAATAHSIDLVGYMSVAVVLAVHLAPALLRSLPKSVLWPTWALCLAGAMYAHASFLTAASSDAAAAQLASSPAAAAAAQQRADIERSLSSIKARPTAQISRQLSGTKDPVRASALQVELADAQRADKLRDQLIALSAGAAAAAAAASSDPVAGTLARAMGVSAEAVALSVSLLLALLLEVIGMLLWREIFFATRHPDQQPDSIPTPAPIAAPQAQAVVQTGMHQIVQFNLHQPVPAAVQQAHENDQPAAQLIDNAPADDVSHLRAAIERGLCQPTVASIRSYMGCGTSKATALRRALSVQ